mmetsp:Transcript_29356/g.84058  ORF Transcript_29356/g.84058 Transcript_29356/m.84058 type:complete len:201 (-) Transcript_29356:160-762(-)
MPIVILVLHLLLLWWFLCILLHGRGRQELRLRGVLGADPGEDLPGHGLQVLLLHEQRGGHHAVGGHACVGRALHGRRGAARRGRQEVRRVPSAEAEAPLQGLQACQVDGRLLQLLLPQPLLLLPLLFPLLLLLLPVVLRILLEPVFGLGGGCDVCQLIPIQVGHGLEQSLPVCSVCTFQVPMLIIVVLMLQHRHARAGVG